ncbi:hypothetical protein LMH73_008205 [Vibrio splendidus]|nr:hypothetical protein [Vibrio splendidus]MCC4880521.1 hypothetical protein [Vibrio splendidus]
MKNNIHELIRSKRLRAPYVGWEQFVVKKDFSEPSIRMVFDAVKMKGSLFTIREFLLAYALDPSVLKVGLEYIDSDKEIPEKIKREIYVNTCSRLLSGGCKDEIGFLAVFKEFVGDVMYSSILSETMELELYKPPVSEVRANQFFNCKPDQREYYIDIFRNASLEKDKIEHVSRWSSFDCAIEVLGEPNQEILKQIIEKDEFGFLLVSYALMLNEKVENTGLYLKGFAACETCYFLDSIEFDDYIGLVSSLAEEWSDISESVCLFYGDFNQSESDMFNNLIKGDIELMDAICFMEDKSIMRHHKGIEILLDRLEKQIDSNLSLSDFNLLFNNKADVASYVNHMCQYGEYGRLLDKINALSRNGFADEIGNDQVFDLKIMS